MVQVHCLRSSNTIGSLAQVVGEVVHCMVQMVLWFADSGGLLGLLIQLVGSSTVQVVHWFRWLTGYLICWFTDGK